MFTNQSAPECSAQAVALLTASVCGYTLFLPFFIFVLFVGFQLFRSKTSATSNSDVFIINITIMEILNILSVNAYYSGYLLKKPHIRLMGEVVGSMSLIGQTVFHNLICVDRYLAVVHPILYLHLKKGGGVKVRNISIGCTWVVSIVFMIVEYFSESITFQIICLILQPTVSIPVVCFCTASVLCVLIRPRPGVVGGDRRASDQSKRKAFNTMMTTLVVLLSRFTVLLLTYILAFFPISGVQTKCIMAICAVWFVLPCSLMSPLLFLNRAGKLPKWK